MDDAHGKHAAKIARRALVKSQKDGKDIRVASMLVLKRSRDETENEGGDDEIRLSSTSARRRRRLWKRALRGETLPSHPGQGDETVRQRIAEHSLWRR
jgi:hypothetical protein